ncbi:MAG: outer membrane protein assembly factor BamD [Phycisphaeraceae bacterium]|nr:outer membrane protein assembly factor BamD [Phycisphaeraceae bacterium]
MTSRHRNDTLAAILLAVAFLAAAPSSLLAQQHYRLEGEQWKKLEAAAPGSPEGQLQSIRQLLAEDQPKKAIKLADKWIEDHPEHPMMAEAYLLRADAKVARKDYYKSLFDYEYLIRVYPASEQFHLALEREYEIARLFASGMKRKWLGIRWISATGEAEEIFIRTQERAPGSELGEKASLALGDFYFDRGEMTSAAQAYDMFRINYPRSRHRERVMERLIDASLARFKGPLFDPTGLIDATQHIKQFQKEFPAAAEKTDAEGRLVRINDSLALKDYYTAKWYEHRFDGRISATYLYRRVIKDHPRSTAASMATQRLAKLQPEANP